MAAARTSVDLEFTLERHILSAPLPTLSLPSMPESDRYKADPRVSPAIVFSSSGIEPAQGNVDPWVRVGVRFEDRAQVSLGSLQESTRRVNYGAVLIDIFQKRLSKKPWLRSGAAGYMARLILLHYERRRLYVREAPAEFFPQIAPPSDISNDLWSIGSVRVDRKGTGYTTIPTVIFTDHDDETSPSETASATAVVEDGKVTSISLDDFGRYSLPPVVSFSGGGGTGAAATAFLSPRFPAEAPSLILLAGAVQEIITNPAHNPYTHLNVRIPFQYEEVD